MPIAPVKNNLLESAFSHTGCLRLITKEIDYFAQISEISSKRHEMLARPKYPRIMSLVEDLSGAGSSSFEMPRRNLCIIDVTLKQIQVRFMRSAIVPFRSSILLLMLGLIPAAPLCHLPV